MQFSPLFIMLILLKYKYCSSLFYFIIIYTKENQASESNLIQHTMIFIR